MTMDLLILIIFCSNIIYQILINGKNSTYFFFFCIARFCHHLNSRILNRRPRFDVTREKSLFLIKLLKIIMYVFYFVFVSFNIFFFDSCCNILLRVKKKSIFKAVNMFKCDLKLTLK